LIKKAGIRGNAGFEKKLKFCWKKISGSGVFLRSFFSTYVNLEFMFNQTLY